MYRIVSKAEFISAISEASAKTLHGVGGLSLLSSSEANFYLAEDKLSGFGVGAEGCTIGVFITKGDMQKLLDAAKHYGAVYGMVKDQKVLDNYLKYNTKIEEQHKDVFGPGQHWTKITWI